MIFLILIAGEVVNALECFHCDSMGDNTYNQYKCADSNYGTIEPCGIPGQFCFTSFTDWDGDGDFEEAQRSCMGFSDLEALGIIQNMTYTENYFRKNKKKIMEELSTCKMHEMGFEQCHHICHEDYCNNRGVDPTEEIKLVLPKDYGAKKSYDTEISVIYDQEPVVPELIDLEVVSEDVDGQEEEVERVVIEFQERPEFKSDRDFGREPESSSVLTQITVLLLTTCLYL